jgi:hypothetical protein
VNSSKQALKRTLKTGTLRPETRSPKPETRFEPETEAGVVHQLIEIDVEFRSEEGPQICCVFRRVMLTLGVWGCFQTELI